MISAFFSGTETAITSASKAHLHQLAKNGSRRAKLAQQLKIRIENVISTALIANQLTNHIIVTITTWLAIDLLGEKSVPVIACIVAFVIVIYAEMVPKIIVIKDASRFTLQTAPVIRFIIAILKPLTAFLEMCARQSIKMLGIKLNERKRHSDEELRGAIDLHAFGGADEAQERLMMKNVLDLDDVEVGQVMVHRKNLLALDCSLPTEKILEEVLKCPYSRIPLWKDNPENIIGILHAKTLFRETKKSLDVNVITMATQPWFVLESTHLLDQLQAFRDRREHFALVVDEYGALMGAITLEDILEEIVGEIVDEYDVTTTGISLQSDGSVLVEGTTLIRDLNRQFDWNLSEDEATTMAGLVMHETRKIPETGQSFIIGEINVEILRKQKNQISLLKVRKLDNNK